MEQNQVNYDFKAFKKLEMNLTIAKASLRSLQLELDHYIEKQGPKEYQAQDYTKLSVGSANVIPTDEFFSELLRKQKAVNEQQKYVNGLEDEFEALKAKMEEASKKFNDLELKVFVLYYIKHNNLYNISNMLNYSYIRIKQVNQNISRLMQ
jgi:DNA-directed RNA polymerase specialized sigma subunit